MSEIFERVNLHGTVLDDGEGLIDETKYPFELDHSKCLLCQGKKSGRSSDGIEQDTICQQCQWSMFEVGIDLRRNHLGRRVLRDVQEKLHDEGMSDIYFDEGLNLKDVVDDIHFHLIKNNPHRNAVLEFQVKRLEQLIEQNLNWESGY